METKICKICEREKPLSDFKISRWGSHNAICRECIKAKIHETRAANRPQIGGVISTTPNLTAKSR